VGSTLAEKVEALLAPEAERHGYELVAVETAGGHHQPVIRVFLDREEGIDIDAICAANEWIADAVDSSCGLDGKYTLEVSSPGLDRPLRKLSDYERFAGMRAKLKTKPADGRSSFTGTIEGVEAGDILLGLEDGTSVHIPFGSVVKARLKGDVDFG